MGPVEAARVVAALEALAGDVGGALWCSGVRNIADDDLLLVTAAVEQLGRRVDALRVAAAGEIGERSRPELGIGRLSARKGCRTPSELIQRVTRVSALTAHRRLRVGAQVRTNFSIAGEPLPPNFPATAASLARGEVGLDSADAVLTALTSILRYTDPSKLRAAETELILAASGKGDLDAVPASADETRMQAAVWKAVLCPDAGRLDDRAMTARGLRLGRERDGVIPLTGSLMPEIGGKLRRLFDAYLSPKTAPVAFHGDEQAAADDEQVRIEHDDRTSDQQRHDVLAVILDVAARSADVPSIGGAAPTVLVSVREQDLSADLGMGRGVGWIDGIDAPLSIEAVKDLICAGGTQEVVLSREGRILRLGVPDRCFTPAQRRAITLRDGGCIIPGCQIPASWSEIHHVIPDVAGGPTHTDNGVLLCWFHHRTLASSGWLIRMVNGVPQVMAPPWIGRRVWRSVTKSQTRLVDAVERDTERPEAGGPGAPPGLD